MDRRALKQAALVRFGGGALVLGALFFGTAGTFRYWEAWVFLATLFLPMAAVVFYFFRHHPGVLERRLGGREERPRQKAIVAVSSAAWIITFLVPGVDQRFGWSSVSPSVVILADALVLAGYSLFFLTLRENAFASRVIRVEGGQQVVSTGLYARVRHPMYLGISLMLVAAPVALGSWWALLPALTTPFFLVVRIQDEEKALVEDLPGYLAYTRAVRYRLFPGVW